MASNDWLDYSGQSTDELIAFENKYRIDSLVVAFGQAIGTKAAQQGEQNLSDEERVVLAIEAFETEVNNGGFAQFFVNSSKEYTPIIVSALQQIGCTGTAAIAEKAVAIAGEKNTSNIGVEEFGDHHEELDESFAETDDAFFNTGESIEEGLFQFIKRNRDKIRV